MNPIAICVLATVALAVASQLPAGDNEGKVVVRSVPPQVAQFPQGAIPIPVSVVLAEAMKKKEEDATPVVASDEDEGEAKKISKRWWHEEETTPTPHLGWPAPAIHGMHGAPTPAPSAPMVGPFAFQLGAYYNPMLPAMVENPPSYPNYPSAPRPAYTPGNIYAPSPIYSNPSSYAGGSSYTPSVASRSYSPY